MASHEIKDYFGSRFGDAGVILEVDFGQLEVVVAACLSNDPQMKQDLRNGVSLHCMSAHFLTGRPYEEMLAGYEAKDPWAVKQRQIGKKLSFELQYGAGPHSMAKKHKLPLSVTEAFVENYYTRYCGLKAWQECVQQEVEGTAQFVGDMFGPTPIRRGTYRAVTGQRFTFTEEPSGRREPAFSFKPTKVKNRPIQGTACTAVVLPALGRTRRALRGDPELRDRCLMVNMVHDSGIFDVHRSVLDRSKEVIHTEFSGIAEHVCKTLNFRIDVPLTADIEVGPTWGNLE